MVNGRTPLVVYDGPGPLSSSKYWPARKEGLGQKYLKG